MAVRCREFSWEVDSACKKAGVDIDAMTTRQKIIASIESMRHSDIALYVHVDAWRRSDNCEMGGWSILVVRGRETTAKRSCVLALSTIDEPSAHAIERWKLGDFDGGFAKMGYSNYSLLGDVSRLAGDVADTIDAVGSTFDSRVYVADCSYGCIVAHTDLSLALLKANGSKSYASLAAKRATLKRSLRAETEELGGTSPFSFSASLCRSDATETRSIVGDYFVRNGELPRTLRDAWRWAADYKRDEAYSKLADILDVVVGDKRLRPASGMPQTVSISRFLHEDTRFIALAVAEVSRAITDRVINRQNDSSARVSDVLRRVKSDRSSRDDKDLLAWADASMLTVGDVLGDAPMAS